MASAFTHAFAAAALGTVLVPRRPMLILIGALCAVLPDADVIAFQIGIRYEHWLGHRGFSHSLVFATCLAALLTALLVRDHRGGHAARGDVVPAWRVALLLLLATASHGVLDAMTNGGLGVAFFSPFDETRYFFPWRPIAVSPISVRRFFTARGLHVLQTEFLVVWIPALVVAILAWVARRKRARA
jgi:inner membrane protein